MKNTSMYWQRHIERQKSTAQSVKRYCERYNISVGMFHYWKRKIRSSESYEQFTEIQLVDGDVINNMIHVRFPTGVEMWFKGQAPSAFLRELAGHEICK
ncbi:MAG: hypothetical protein IPM92_11835 [Saprospiraceae bacterium]|nr:hypothetical protein [Saprospiraceae bacterium]